MTRRFAVIGDPVAHSRSPVMHEAAFRALGLDASYERVHVRPDGLAAFLRGVAADRAMEGTRGYEGLNVTLPHKSAVIPLLAKVTPRAARIGAVNTITVRGGALLGDNTDGAGLVRSLGDAAFAPAGARVVILGAGGAARAAAVGLSDAGAAEVRVAARRPAASIALATDLNAAGSSKGAPKGAGRITGHGFDALDDLFTDTDLVIQATSATLEGNDAASTFASSLPWDALPTTAVVTDLVYQPLETTVLRAARARGLGTVDGLGMLVHQGALAFEAWLGVAAPVEAMRAALL